MDPINEPPPGYRPADDLRERLFSGCGLIVGGIISMGVAFLFWQIAPLTVPGPPGTPSDFMPMASPLACMVPLIAVLSAGLVLLGLRRLLGLD